MKQTWLEGQTLMVLAKWHMLSQEPQNAEDRLEEASKIFKVEFCLHLLATKRRTLQQTLTIEY